METTGDIAIIGAGLTGLSAAGALRMAGQRTRVFEKSRGPGGRLATRRAGAARIDHGAPALEADDGAFAAVLDRTGAVSGAHGWVGRPTMNTIGKSLATGLAIRTETEVATVEGGPGAWTLRTADGASEGPFRAVVVTAPAPQAARILAGVEGFETLGQVVMAPAWTLLAVFGERVAAFDRIARQGDVHLALRMSRRPDRPPEEAWAVHMSAAFSRAHLETAKDEMAPRLLEVFAAVADRPLPDPTYLAAHRWRYAVTERPLGAAFAADPSGTCLAGGDWVAGRLGQNAWRAGRDMAYAVLSGVRAAE